MRCQDGEVLAQSSDGWTNSISVSLSEHQSRDLGILAPYQPAPYHPRSPEQPQAWHVNPGLVERRCLDVGDDERPPVGTPECHIGDLGAGNRDLLDHLPRWSEDRDFTPAVVSDVEVAGLVERHAVRTFPAGEEGKIVTRANGAIWLDQVAKDAVAMGLRQIDGGAVD